MLRAIKLDDQLRRHTAKISDIGRNGILAPELEALQLAASQATPQFVFGVGHGPAQQACVFQC
jgi:hypothetical protein